MPKPTLEELDHDLRLARKGLKTAGVPMKVLDSIKTRALKTGRRLTGPNQGNRKNRWQVSDDDPQYGGEEDCKTILLRLYAAAVEFKNAPEINEETKTILQKHLGRPIKTNSFRDLLTKERLDFANLVAESETPQHGRSEFHLGHENPKATPRHIPSNVTWRSARSNLIQGDLTLAEARTKFVEVIARYFELGEVKIEPEE